jgi:o-succinylbenzoate---CoA ligase
LKTESAWLLQQFRCNPGATALRSAGMRMTWGELYELAGGYAAYLHSRGVRRNTRAAVVAQNSIDYAAILHALLLLEAVIVPINVRLTETEMRRQLRFAECAFVITDADNPVDDGIVSIAFSELHAHAPAKFPGEPPVSTMYRDDSTDRTGGDALDRTIVMMYTSGTTGDPRCAELTQGNFLYSALATYLRLDIHAGDSWLLSLPLYHIGGLSIVTRSAIFGNAVIVPASLHTESIADAIARHDPALMSLVPTMLRRLIEAGVEPNSSQKAVLLGGGPIHRPLVEDARSRGWKIAPTYGATETCSQTALRAPDAPDNPDPHNTPGADSASDENPSAGAPLPFVNIRIEDENGNETPAGTPGEIVVTSPVVMKGYHGSPPQPAVVDAQAPVRRYRTGDYGYIDGASGELHVLARRTDLIVTGGENVHPAEVEDALLRHPSVREACVFPLEDEEWGHVPAAAVVADGAIESGELLRFVSDALAPYKRPKKFFFLDSLPYNEQGKVMRATLRQICSK